MCDADNRALTKSNRSNRPDVSADLKDLLNRLDLSPSVLLEEDALAIDDNSSASSERGGSIRNADSGSGYPEQFSTTITVDRRVLLEEFAVVRAKGEIYAARNGFFHDQLVKHFKRKQMMRAYGELNEEDPLKNTYFKKLTKYENFRQELQAGEEDSRTEIGLLRDELREKTEEADAVVDELVAKERAAGAQAYSNGKPLAVKEIQSLITRKFGKMKDISRVRIRYARLRDTLVEKEVVSDALNILTPNLDRNDYERLEAENFHYKHELRIKETECENLAIRRVRLSRRLKAIKRKRNKVSLIIHQRRDELEQLKRKVVSISQLRLIRREEIQEMQNYFEKLESILGLRLYPEVNGKINAIPRQRDEWLKKVAAIISEIKKADECLNALSENKTLRESGETTDEDGQNDDGISYPEKSSRPPLGGGFLQAL